MRAHVVVSISPIGLRAKAGLVNYRFADIFGVNFLISSA